MATPPDGAPYASGSREDVVTFDMDMPTAELIQEILTQGHCALSCPGLLLPGCVYEPAVIKAQHHQLTLRVHPDKASHPDGQEAFIRVQAAYESLAAQINEA